MWTLVLNYIGNDGFNRPVYENGNKLFVDVDPRSTRQPVICTVLNDCFGGEPDTPIIQIEKYANAELQFFPKRITW